MIMQLLYGLVGVLAVLNLQAATLQADIVNAQGQGVADAILALTPQGAALPPLSALEPAVILQKDRMFAPLVTVIRRGQAVRFPNEDRTRHHVYSVSQAKRFEIPLYARQEPPPVVFETAGVIVLGCNIHDHMLGYLFVLDAPYFAKSDASGRVTLPALPGGDYTVQVWHPGLKDYALAPEPLRLNPTETHNLSFTLKLRAMRLWQPKAESAPTTDNDAAYE